MDAMLAKGGADLRFLFDRKGVDDEFAAKLYSIGITTVELFAVFAKDQGDLENILKTHFETDTNGGSAPAKSLWLGWPLRPGPRSSLTRTATAR